MRRIVAKLFAFRPRDRRFLRGKTLYIRQSRYDLLNGADFLRLAHHLHYVGFNSNGAVIHTRKV
jgi:hypothetical protein